MKLIFRRKELEHISDEELLTRYLQSGDLTIFTKLFSRYDHLLFGLCLKYLKEPEEAKDAVMDLFELLSEKVNNTQIQSFQKWLYVTAKNHCLMILRKRKRDLKNEKSYHDDMESTMLLHLNGEDESMDLSCLTRKLVDELEPGQRRCIELFYFENLSYKQIVEETGFTLKHVKSYIQNGRRNLSNKMKGNY
jgi:RNA polymerase sigma-70 factor (ECF subfamily)